MSDTLKTIKLADIQPADDNLRFELTDIEDLAQSIAFIGLLEPIRVTKDGQQWKVAAGHRRLAALLHNGETETKAIVQSGKMGDDERTAIMLIENMQRVDLEPREQAIGVQRLIQEHGFTQAQVAENLGTSRQWVKDRVAMLNVPEHCFEPDKFGRVLPVNDLAALGSLPADRLDRLTKDDKVPSSYDIQTQQQKQASVESAEKRLKKMVKDGHLAVSEKELKEIMKTDLAECDGIRQLVKLKIGDAEQIRSNYWDKFDVPVLNLERIHFPDKEEWDKNTVYVVRSAGGFMEWSKASVIPPAGTQSDTDDDEYDQIDAINDKLRADHTEAKRAAEKQYIDTAKPAELINGILVSIVSELKAGYRIRENCRVLDALGLDYETPDDGLSFEDRDAAVAELFDTVWGYASKNASNLARAAAATAVATRRDCPFTIDYPADPEYVEYPEDEDELTPLETGI